MNLPSYFLADLPPEAELNAALISEACQTLKRNRERYLEARSTDGTIRLLDSLAREWLSPEFPFRQFVIGASPEGSRASQRPFSWRDSIIFFQSLTAENLESMLWQDLGHPQRLDSFFPNERGFGSQRSAMALGPQLIAHIAPGNLPIPIMMDMVLGLLARSAQFVKCASGQSFVPRMFAHSLYEADHKIGACLEIAEWKGGEDSLESALFEETDCVTATGSDETLAVIFRKIPRKARFLGYGTRVSFGYITRESLRQTQSVVKRAAQDVIAWNQCGCLSPHVIYVEEGGAVTGETFADLLAKELEVFEATHPRGALTATESADITRRPLILRNSRRAFARNENVGQQRIDIVDCGFGERSEVSDFLPEPIHLR